ncbi:MAG: molybdenum cofactor guanylyltransferase [Glaciecola sp.]|jgi:molybdopterin-guanine dinucleotide biosynthesis protein A
MNNISMGMLTDHTTDRESMPASNDNTIAIVLAGGASSRMGKDKALLEIDGETMLARTKALLEETNVTKVMVSRNTSQTDHRPEYFSDIIPHKGPLSGIHSFAFRFPNANLLILPVDLPLMDSSSLQSLIDCGVKNERNVCYHGHHLPLYLRNTNELRFVLDYTLKFTNQYSVERLCSHFPIIELRPKKQSCLFNANTPSQWRFASEHFGQHPISNQKEYTHGAF